MTQVAEKKDNANYADHFTRIPNIVFVSYKHLTKEEKFLYARLRCLFWDTTPHDLSLRELAELTDYSAGALSKMLPRLHKVGLIHAEVKKKQNKNGKEIGNAVYHVSICDIWEINKRYFTCSPNEQVDPSDILVHENTQACSPNDTSLFTKCDKPVSFDEQVRAQKQDIKTKKILSKKKEEESMPSVATPPACADAPTHSSSVSEKESSQEQQNNSHIASEATSTQSPPVTSKQPSDEGSKQSASSQSTPAQDSERRTIRNGTAQGTSKRDLYMKEARMYGVQALEDTVDMMLRWDEINVVCGHPKWEWLALEKIVVLAHGTIEQMKRVREKLQAKGQKLTPETIWTNWWMLDSQATSSRQPRGLPPEVQKAMEESRRQKAIEHHRTAIEISQKGNFQHHRELAQKAAAEREARGQEDDYEELMARVKPDPIEVVKITDFEDIFGKTA